MLSIAAHPQGLAFKVRVQPKSSRNLVAGLHGDALKLKLTAPPVEGAANKMCIHFLAERLRLSKASIEILSGHHSRSKTVLVRCAPAETADIQTRIKKLLVP